MSQSKPGCFGRILRTAGWVVGGGTILAVGIVIGQGTPASTEPQSRAVPTYTPTPIVVKATSTPVAQVTDEQRFLAEMDVLLVDYATAFNDLSAALNLLADDAVLMFDDVWKRSVRASADKILDANLRARKMDVPAKYKASWDNFLMAGFYYDNAMHSMMDGVDNHNWYSLNLAQQDIVKAQTFLDRAIAEMPK